MASIFRRKEKTHPNDLVVEFKATGTDGSGNTVYAEVLALDPGSISSGGAVTIADGANVAQGTTTDASSANTVIGLLKAVKAAVTGTLSTARTWTLSSGTDSVNVGNFPASQAVTGTFWQTTQPVSIATNTPDVTDRSARLLGHVTVDSAPTTAVTGTVTANAGTNLNTSALALDATLTGGTARTKVTDGTNNAAVKAASTAAAATDPALVVAVSPNNTVPVSGTFFQATQPVSGTVTANAGTNLNTSALALDATLTGGTQKAVARGGAKGTTAAADITSNPVDANTQALHVDGSKVTQPVSGTFWQATQPVSGTVTANIGTSGSLALDATLTGGTARTKITDGTNNVAVKAASTAVAAADSPLAVGLHPSSPLPAGTAIIGALSANQSVNNAQIGGATVSTAASGVQKVGVVGNAGAILDGATGAAVPANAVYLGGNLSGNLTGVVLLAPNDGQASQNDVMVNAQPALFNGTTWDRQRANVNTTTGDTGAKTANFTGATQTNFNARGAVVTLVVGAVSGTFTTFQTGLQWSPDGGTTWLAMTPLGANITTPASGNTIVWHVYPGALTVVPAASAGGAAPTQYNTAGIALPRTWRFAITLAGTTPSLTVTAVDVNYIL